MNSLIKMTLIYLRVSKGGAVYAKPNRLSSNCARDKAMSLGQEPTVDSSKTFIKRLETLRTYKLATKEKKSDIKLQERQCPDPSLYEDLVENLNIGVTPDNIFTEAKESSECEAEGETQSKPFLRLESFLFSCFTWCVPWCLMRRVYWNYK